MGHGAKPPRCWGVKYLTYQDPEVLQLKYTNARGRARHPYHKLLSACAGTSSATGAGRPRVSATKGVAVVAESEQIAEQALRLVDIELEVLPFRVDYEDGVPKPGAPIVHPVSPRRIHARPTEFGGPAGLRQSGRRQPGL